MSGLNNRYINTERTLCTKMKRLKRLQGDIQGNYLE